MTYIGHQVNLLCQLADCRKLDHGGVSWLTMPAEQLLMVHALRRPCWFSTQVDCLNWCHHHDQLDIMTMMATSLVHKFV